MWLATTALILHAIRVGGAEYGDPTPQELALLDWASGIRIAYCRESPITELTEPFRRQLGETVNQYCRNYTACGLRRTVTFDASNVLLLDGFPRRDFGAVQFRFVIVLPHGAQTLEKQQKPLLLKAYLSGMFNKHVKEFGRTMGWQVLSFEKYPRFDEITTFMNTAILPIGITAGIACVFLACWSTTLSTSSGSEGWLVSGSKGGKNAALRRTLEIIEEQKLQMAHLMMTEREEKRVQLAIARAHFAEETKSSEEQDATTSGYHIGLIEKRPLKLLRLSTSVEGVDEVDSERLPEIVVVNTRGSKRRPSRETLESIGRKMSMGSGQRRHSRRLSSIDEFRIEPRKTRKARGSVFTSSAAKRSRGAEKRWKAGSLMFSGFGARS
uniref:Thioredoxin-like_fold domain-containing protein n=1 Tax=Steinernema glaseri TaxID=37863 RepID=A0A1I8AVG8_9BILA